MYENILVTGGAGFIGSHFLELLLDRTQANILIVDALTYAGDKANLPQHPRCRFVQANISDAALMFRLMAGMDAVVNFAAESHVDRSIDAPARFVETNIQGVQVLLDAARHCKVKRFLHISTDEVYGELGATGYFHETTPLCPSSPYSASKAAADMLVLAWARTYGMNVGITRCSNNYGPRQFPEKLIPTVVQSACQGLPVLVYGDGQNVRDWIYVMDHCEGVLQALFQGEPGRIYNLGGQNEQNNLELVKRILALLGKPESLIRFIPDRPGHDRRYGVDCTRAQQELGWKAKADFQAELAKTVAWYADRAALRSTPVSAPPLRPAPL